MKANGTHLPITNILLGNLGLHVYYFFRLHETLLVRQTKMPILKLKYDKIINFSQLSHAKK